MKRILAVTAALALLAPAMPAAAKVVIKDKHHGVVVKVGPGHHRAGHFWHRGGWFVRIHGPAYRYPRGWGYRKWAIGAVLPALFLTTEYYYDGYADAGLQVPPPGYRWVRYGPDLLLVNVRTGQVEDVVEDAFD